MIMTVCDDWGVFVSYLWNRRQQDAIWEEADGNVLLGNLGFLHVCGCDF